MSYYKKMRNFQNKIVKILCVRRPAIRRSVSTLGPMFETLIEHSIILHTHKSQSISVQIPPETMEDPKNGTKFEQLMTIDI